LTGGLGVAQLAHVASPTQSIAARNQQAHDARSPAVRKTLAVVLVLNAIVLTIKIVVGVRTGALTVLGAALESGLDVLNNVIGMLLVAVASRAPDEDHPYGHDKFETLGALAIVGFLSISCFELLRQGVMQMLDRHVPEPPTVFEIALLAATALVNVLVVWYERKRGRELSSAFLMADAAHTSSDLYVTLLALASLGLARIGHGALDPLLAVIVALLIAWNGYAILRENVPILVDRRAVDASEIRRLVGEIPEIHDVRDVRSRATPSGVLFAEVTIGVAANISVAHAHALADQVETRIGERLGTAQVTVHVEPA
jgi:cation diffusion facilitator family transporter